MPHPHEHMLDLYLDGQLDEPQCASFERAAADDPAIAAQVDLQQTIDAVLRKSLEPPSFDSVFAQFPHGADNGRISTAAAPRISTGMSPARRYLAAAALIAITAAAIWRAWVFMNPPQAFDPYRIQSWRSLEQVYRDKLADGFTVDWTCKDDTEFRSTFANQLGQPMLLASVPANVQALGLGYCNSLSPNTVYLLALINGQKVIVFIDRASADTTPQKLGNPALNLFRREVGTLVLYELTPLDRSYVLDLFYDPSPATPP